MVTAKTKTTEKKSALRYIEATGGRKTATARVRLHPKESGVLVNGKSLKEYFVSVKDQIAVMSPLQLSGLEKVFKVSAKVSGSGIHAQAQAVRNGVAKALAVYDPALKKKLKVAGFISRDARVVERKKYGLKKARRAPQWSKR